MRIYKGGGASAFKLPKGVNMLSEEGWRIKGHFYNGLALVLVNVRLVTFASRNTVI